VNLPFLGSAKDPKSGVAREPEPAVEEKEGFTRIGVDQAKALIDGGGIEVIDVREAWEYKQGHIPQAHLIPLNTLLRQPREFLTGKRYIFVCAVGERSAVACEMAAALGIKEIYNLEGGTQAWIARGYPVERGA
jgi:rhodanese-related sulfurtransferase